MSGPDIFISYSRGDRPKARHYADCLEREGFSVWWDAALSPGETFDEVIEAELRAAKIVVVLWSPNSVSSRWVRAEATLADRRKKLVPIILDPCDLPLIFEMMHTTDLSAWNGDTNEPTWSTFVRDLHRMIGPSAASGPPADGIGRREHDEYTAGIATPASTTRTVSFGGARRSLEPKPVEAEADAEHTQFYTRSDRFGVLSDQFHCLETLDDDGADRRFVVSPTGLTIGRKKPADVILADGKVSRLHCRVELADDRLRVSDLDSTNGTFIDDQRIEGEDMLEVGSVLKVGHVRFTHAVRSRADVRQS